MASRPSPYSASKPRSPARPGAGAAATWSLPPEASAAPIGLETTSSPSCCWRAASPRDDLARHRSPTLRAFLPDPSEFRDMDAAAERLGEAVLARRDGHRLRRLRRRRRDQRGAADPPAAHARARGAPLHPRPPARGLWPVAARRWCGSRDEGSSLIVTVDCGAMAHEALAMAHDAGIDVIVVDHHKCAAELPRASALVNPNRLDESETGAAHGHLAAVGVAFLLAVADGAHAAPARLLRRRAPSPTCSRCSISSRSAPWPTSPRSTGSTARSSRKASRSWRGASNIGHGRADRREPAQPRAELQRSAASRSARGSTPAAGSARRRSACAC